ncbi:molybdopterin molybdenumtransferase MoeA [Altererythrobacter sp. B11]|uniref:molybdopterin molybdotransferase MoeA n=1 Tax=Altererythrobacter sp. B11 TaxID=2060312 RepID=UPI000DC6FCB4|nr:molybdopterin molybdotransferase MoeA [Altererythrobacter sp. B11]BBC73033.1 molybdopterin molybdenumtransferase MoeA [Altererythrobacter sp. B11]
MSLPEPIPLGEAQARLLAMAEPRGSETLPVEAALGRFLAAELAAQRDQPAADLSAMDGYAMRADDLSGPWKVVGESAAGHPFAGALRRGEAIRISTGALMPAEGGAVLLQEEAVGEGERLTLAPAGEAAPRHVRRAGFDFRRGAGLLAGGTRLGPAQIALAISAGHASVPVGQRPALVVIDSGDELAETPENCPPHRIPASNGAMLAAMAAPWAGSVMRIGPVRDDLGALADALARTEGADVVVTSGGASVGDHDLVRPALEAWGARIDFWRVAMKPGKPLLVARRGRQIVLGLPGNPVSSYVTAFLFLLPLLRRIAGAAEPLPRLLGFPLAGDLPGVGGRLEFVRARLDPGGLAPIAQQDSSALAALGSADALIRREIGAPAARAGEMVQAYLLENGGIA